MQRRPLFALTAISALATLAGTFSLPAFADGKETNLSFYTSDITGKFRIVVQGITSNDVIYGEHFFEVKPKVNP